MNIEPQSWAPVPQEDPNHAVNEIGNARYSIVRHNWNIKCLQNAIYKYR